MKLSTFWFAVGVTTLLLLDSSSFVLGAKKVKNECKYIDGKEVEKSVCQDKKKCELNSKKREMREGQEYQVDK
eukprot:CAMPEP_0170940242 /NCGR_PEP_ID=MMETSP0735-20130129/22553_1 /TAXON_ID=186038 /ORGANISM="Fragilariopsis kerguelensis, Strain L26-C5" /LENGTH=72 /DNA_ID=CAMNT_0011346057 /DNA_START=89 /DNA_END=304 /DNA_ORIENTATION=-